MNYTQASLHHHTSHRHLHVDLLVRVVAVQFEVVELEPVDILHGGVNFKVGEGVRHQRVQLFQALDVVLVDVHIGHHMDEFSSLEASDLRDEAGEEGVAGDVEGHAEAHVAAALVEDAVQLVAGAHLELAQQVALDRGGSTGGRAISRSWEGFQADMISLRLEGFRLIYSITHRSWSSPCPEQSVCLLTQGAFQWRHWKPQTGPRSPASRSSPRPARYSLELLPAQILMFFLSSTSASVEPLTNHNSYSATPRQNTFLCVSSGKVWERSYRMAQPNNARVPVPVRSSRSQPVSMMRLMARMYWYSSCSGSPKIFYVGRGQCRWLQQSLQSKRREFSRKVLETQLQERWSQLGAKTSQGTSSATSVQYTYLQSPRASSKSRAPPTTYALPWGSHVAERAKASVKLLACLTFSVSGRVEPWETTMVRRFGSGLLPMDSKVLRPMMMLFREGPEVVIFLNILRSEGSFQGRELFLPMPPFMVLPITRSNGIWRISKIYKKLSKQEKENIRIMKLQTNRKGQGLLQIAF